MKVIFLASTYATVFLIFHKFKATYDSNHDSFRAEFLVVPVGGLAVLVNHELSVMEVGAGCLNSVIIILSCLTFSCNNAG